MDNKFRSRKFIVTVCGMSAGVIAAYTGNMSGDLAMILATGMGMYNYSQGKIDEQRRD
jgi:hypothetical protein